MEAEQPGKGAKMGYTGCRNGRKSENLTESRRPRVRVRHARRPPRRARLRPELHVCVEN